MYKKQLRFLNFKQNLQHRRIIMMDKEQKLFPRKQEISSLEMHEQQVITLPRPNKSLMCFVPLCALSTGWNKT